MESLPITKESRKILVAIIVGVLTVLAALLISITFQFGIIANLVMSWLFTTAYSIFAFFMVEPVVRINPTRIVERPVVQEVIQVVEKPVVHEIQVPIENKVIEVVEKPVIREVPVERKVIRYVERKHRKLNIPRFNFIGSTEARTYHKRTCRFSKLIKKKYKAHSNTKIFFKRKHYHACKSCIKSKR